MANQKSRVQGGDHRLFNPNDKQWVLLGGSQTGGKKKLPAALVPHMKIAVKGGELWRKLSPAQQAAWKARDGKGSGYMKWMKAEGRRQAMAALGITQAYLDGLKASKK